MFLPSYYINWVFRIRGSNIYQTARQAGQKNTVMIIIKKNLPGKVYLCDDNRVLLTLS